MGTIKITSKQIQKFKTFKCDIEEYFSLISQQIRKLSSENNFSKQCKKKAIPRANDLSK